MECEKIRELILDYSDGDLNQSDKLGVEKHLKECKECNIYFEQSHKVWNLLDNWHTVEIKNDFIPRFWDRVTTEDRKKGNAFDFFRNLRPNLISGGVGVIILILVVFLVNILVSHHDNIVFTEGDRSDEELLIEFDRSITKETAEPLEIYGPWSDEIEENKGG